jgi:uncharacterized protein
MQEKEQSNAIIHLMSFNENGTAIERYRNLSPDYVYHGRLQVRFERKVIFASMQIVKQISFLVSGIFILSCITYSVCAQQLKPGVKLLGRATDHSIRLRWAPNDPILWHLSNKYGYTLERITLTENNKIVDPVKIILHPQPFRPASQVLWEQSIEKDDYVAVAAQAIFGETFDVNQKQTSALVKVINKAKELESRFSFAVFSADQSVKAAELSGLYFEDESIAPFTKYLYRVYSNVPQNLIKADTGLILLGLQDHAPLPTIKDLQGEFDDHRVMLSWDGSTVEKIYNSFWLERSVDNKVYRRVTNIPIVNAFSGEKKKSDRIFKADSLEANDVVYYYRVLGIDAFGGIGPPSDTISGSGKSQFAFSASIRNHLIHQDGTVTLEWDFPPNGNFLLASFDLTRLDVKTKTSETIQTGISKLARSVSDNSPSSSNYYVIRSKDKYGRYNNSFPYLVQLEDSIPPNPPDNINGKIDSLGFVHLQWNANKENDLLGYGVYRANFASDEFVQLPGDIVNDHHYEDTISLNNLTEKIYYRITAIDKRFNPSGFSATLELKKPDKVPPVPPVFTSIRNDSTGIFISWENSGSEDVVQHLLYRKKLEDVSWNLIRQVEQPNTLNYFIDVNVNSHESYAYTMIAIDDDQLESVPLIPISIKWISPLSAPPVTEIYTQVNRDQKMLLVKWVYNEPDVKNFLIYKSGYLGKVSLFKLVPVHRPEFFDDLKNEKELAFYQIVSVFNSGRKSHMSRKILAK